LTDVGTQDGMKGRTDEIAEKGGHWRSDAWKKEVHVPMTNKTRPETMERTGNAIAVSTNAVPL
jgi:hypothetical protein